MTASNQTIAEVIEVIRRHVDDRTFVKIVTELKEVKGNSSFETTIERMYKAVMKAQTDQPNDRFYSVIAFKGCP